VLEFKYKITAIFYAVLVFILFYTDFIKIQPVTRLMAYYVQAETKKAPEGAS
jgi:hypothetical protein